MKLAYLRMDDEHCLAHRQQRCVLSPLPQGSRKNAVVELLWLLLFCFVRKCLAQVVLIPQPSCFRNSGIIGLCYHAQLFSLPLLSPLPPFLSRQRITAVQAGLRLALLLPGKSCAPLCPHPWPCQSVMTFMLSGHSNVHASHSLSVLWGTWLFTTFSLSQTHFLLSVCWDSKSFPCGRQLKDFPCSCPVLSIQSQVTNFMKV